MITALHPRRRTDFRPARKAHAGLTVSTLDTLARRLVHTRCPVTRDELFPGYHRGPGRHRIELLQPAAG